ncbi:MAG TPA: type I-B CRISPR-associated protein Cas5 [Bacteroidales bacterium]|nr:type I-B CRISPR-associated protein Cas5 [Bacteroidales bacterium]
MNKLISIDIFADFGMLKKPDTNEPVYLTFNMLHKPALLGILGAIIGESGFKTKGVLPDYYLKLIDLKIGIQPLNHEHGNYQKTIITYNNTTGMASQEQGGNLMITEQTLVAPAYRCYFLFDLENEIHQNADENLSKYYAEYLPYLGKNEFSVWWKNYTIYDFSEFEANDVFKISSIYIKDSPLKDSKTIQDYDPFFDEKLEGNTFSYFERLPIGYTDIGKKTYQYEYRNFAFTDWSLELKTKNSNLLLNINNDTIIQVF